MADGLNNQGDKKNMIIVAPGSHPEADKVWEQTLNKKPNGARVLGNWQKIHLSKLFEPYYDMLVTYAAEIPFDIPKGVKRIAICWHSNFPWAAGITKWRRVNKTLAGYEVDYFVNEQHLIELIEEQGGRAFYLPRFVDTKALPKPKEEKTIPTLWYGNRWAEFGAQFAKYSRRKHAYWISGGFFGKGDKALYEVDRKDALRILNEAKYVWAIGVSQLEAKYLGAEIISYRDAPLPYYDQKTIVPYTKELLNEINLRRPGLGK